MRRSVALPLVLVVVLAVGGCVQAVTGDTITFEAQNATVAEGALERNGYELADSQRTTIERTVEVPVLGPRDVVITNHLAVYARRNVDDANASRTEAAGLFVLSTPQAQLAGQPANPIGRAPLKDLVRRLANEAGGRNEVEHIGSTDITVLGSSTTVEKFSSTTRTEGREVDTYVYVTRVPHEGDYVVAVAVIPQTFDDEESDLYELMEAIEHDGE